MIYLIRHAESLSNVGFVTNNVKEIPLTGKGIQQSIELLEKIPSKPDLIVVSPYLRTQQTAEPLIKKYPEVPVEIWDVHEFTYLDADRCDGTTQAERKIIREEYIAKNDPDFIHGKGAESFNQMLERVDEMFSKLRRIDPSKFVVIYTHGLFIRTALARKNRKNVTIDDAFNGIIINNTDIVELSMIDRAGAIIIKDGIEVIPPKYIDAISFKQGKAFVSLSDRVLCIDKQGNEILPSTTSYDII